MCHHVQPGASQGRTLHTHLMKHRQLTWQWDNPQADITGPSSAVGHALPADSTVCTPSYLQRTSTVHWLCNNCHVHLLAIDGCLPPTVHHLHAQYLCIQTSRRQQVSPGSCDSSACTHQGGPIWRSPALQVLLDQSQALGKVRRLELPCHQFVAASTRGASPSS